MVSKGLIPWLAVLALLVCAPMARAHAPGETYTWVNVETDHFTGGTQLRLEDLRNHLRLDVPRDLEAAGPVVVAAADVLQAVVRAGFELRTEDGEVIPYEFTKVDVERATAMGHYAAVHFRTAAGSRVDRIVVRNEVLVDRGETRRAMTCVTYDRHLGKQYGGEFVAAVHDASEPIRTVDYTELAGKSLLNHEQLLVAGVRSATGPRSVLFVFAALVSAAAASGMARGRAGEGGTGHGPDDVGPPERSRMLRHGLVAIVALGAAFAVGLAAGAIGAVRVPETALVWATAATVVLVAGHTLCGLFRGAAPVALFLLALVHGVDFAARMNGLRVQRADLQSNLVWYGAGVGAGTAAVAALLLVAVAMLAARPSLRRPLLGGGAVAAAIAAVAVAATIVFGVSP